MLKTNVIKKSKKARLVKLLTALTTLRVLATSKNAYAAGGTGDPVTGINTWGNTALDIVFAVFKWGGIFSILFLAMGIYANNDETAGKRMKIGLYVVIIVTFIGWFAKPIYNKFVV